MKLNNSCFFLVTFVPLNKMNQMNILIITGGSKGLGKSTAKLFQKNGYKVYSLARSINSKLEAINQLQVDLSNTKESIVAMNNLLDVVLEEKPSSVTLINNAGTLGEINVLAEIPPSNIESTVTLNYTSPMILCSIFAKKLSDFSGTKKIRNISSGAANGTYHGWSVYCSTKSAMDSFTKVLAVEQSYSQYPIHVLSVYPGVIDTEMQSQIRNTTEKTFANVERFRELKSNNDLSSPDEIAEIIFKINSNNELQNGGIVDVRDFN